MRELHRMLFLRLKRRIVASRVRSGRDKPKQSVIMLLPLFPSSFGSSTKQTCPTRAHAFNYLLKHMSCTNAFASLGVVPLLAQRFRACFFGLYIFFESVANCVLNGQGFVVDLRLWVAYACLCVYACVCFAVPACLFVQ